jgi:hypothetical protein
MPDFFQTMMGKRFIEGTIPSLVRAIDKLNKNLEPQIEYDTLIALLYTNDGDRKDLEHIEGQKFNSLYDVHAINENISVYSLSDFTEMVNNNDSECDDIHLQDRWIGYIKLRQGAIQEYQKYQDQNYNKGDK